MFYEKTSLLAILVRVIKKKSPLLPMFSPHSNVPEHPRSERFPLDC